MGRLVVMLNYCLKSVFKNLMFKTKSKYVQNWRLSNKLCIQLYCMLSGHAKQSLLTLYNIWTIVHCVCMITTNDMPETLNKDWCKTLSKGITSCQAQCNKLTSSFSTGGFVCCFECMWMDSKSYWLVSVHYRYILNIKYVLIGSNWDASCSIFCV